MISFYPGPSRVYENVPLYVKEAYDKGILSVNHRSQEFMDMVKDTNLLIKKKLGVPDDYSIFYVSSATECWQIITQAYGLNSYHFYNGAFGQKWFEYTKKLKKNIIGYRYHFLSELKMGELDLSADKGLICITQNETSNGTQVSGKRIAKIRKKYPDQLIAVDATSSMAGVNLEFSDADIWFASVQKCFGLPAGMAVMICSPKAIDEAKKANKTVHYNSLASIIANMERLQTTHTPNVLSIFLLMKTLQEAKSINKVEQELNERLIKYYDIVSSKKTIKPLITKKKIRSTTVLVLEGDEATITDLKKKAKEEGLILGNGYGEWKTNTFRIANFPALKDKEVKKLLSFLDQYIQ
jgi:phosphoserine aminotransferase